MLNTFGENIRICSANIYFFVDFIFVHISSFFEKSVFSHFFFVLLQQFYVRTCARQDGKKA